MSNILSAKQHEQIAANLEKQARDLRNQAGCHELWMIQDTIAKRLRDAAWHKQVAARKAGKPAIFTIDGVAV